MSTTTPHTQTAYKDTPIGKIPADWEVKKIGEIFNSFPTASYSRADLVEEGEILYLHYGDIHTKFDFHLDVSKATLPSITEEKLKKYEVVKEGDWVLCDASEDYDGVGKSVEIFNLDEKKLIAGLHTFLLREKGNFFAPYFKGYVTLNESVRKQFQKLATGTKVYSLSKETLLSVKIPLPPLSEQKRIAEVLSTWDQAIQLTEQLIRQKEQRKKWLMQQLLTGKKRLFSSDDLGDISYELQKVKLGDLIKLASGDTKPNDTNQFFTSTYAFPVYGGNGIMCYSKEFNSSDERIIIGRVGEYCGVTRIVFQKCWITDNALYTNKIDDSVSILYLFYKLQFEDLSKLRSVAGQPLVSQKPIYNLSLLIHRSKHEQTAIAEVLQTADKEIELLKAKAEQLKEQKKGLMQQLLTGKVRLKIQ